MAPTSRLGPIPRWDLSNVYPGLDSAEFQQASSELTTRLDDLDQYLAARGIGVQPALDAPALAESLAGFIDRRNTLLRLSATLRAYIWSFVSTDSYNALAKRLYSELQIQVVRGQQLATRFQGWLGQQASLLPEALKLNPTAQAHAFMLTEMAEQSRYLMSDPEEALAAELSLSGAQAWGKLQGTLTSQLTWPFERNGKTEKIPMPALINIWQHDPDAEVRRSAYEAELAAWETVQEPLAACLNGVKGAAHTLNQHRGRTDALHSALDASRIDRETLQAMLGAMEEYFPVFRRYLRAKAKKLGQSALPWWDIFAPVGRNERVYAWPELEEFIVLNFGRFSDRLAQFARRAFAGGWIDAEMRDGKRGGGFCMSVPGVEESRILCNFDGSLDQLGTVAHELGHAFHNECLRERTLLNRDTPMTLAETASIFCQTIITDAALQQARSPEEELAILETFLIDATQVVVDIFSRYHFEQEVFERRAKTELSAEEFCEIMLRAQEKTYGDGIDLSTRHKYMWTWKPHYYYAGLSFYNYPYAFGLLFGLGLYALYQQRGPAFVADYESLLGSTGLGTAAKLAGRFGINLREKDFWRGSLKMIEKRIERYLEL